jgi:hypothetical protein
MFQAHRLERAQPAHAEHKLLPHARVGVAAVERVGDAAILRQLILRDIGVQKVERHTSDFHLPDLNHDLAGGQADEDFEVLALRIEHRNNREGVEVVGGIALLLPAVGVQHLAEIALLVEQADGDQRQVAIAGRFQVIAGEHAQTAGVDGETLRKAVLGREVGDQFAVGARLAAQDVRVVALARHIVERQVARVGRRALQGDA